MVKETILSYEEYQSVKPTTTNDKIRLEQFIWEVENFDIANLVGGRETYLKLLDASKSNSVVFQNIYHNGLKQAIAFLTYSKYVKEGILIDTFSGVKMKTSEYSDHSSYGTLKNVSNEYREQGVYWLEQVAEDIRVNYGTTCGCNASSRPLQNDIINIKRF